jgi:hypothetical protein
MKRSRAAQTTAITAENKSALQAKKRNKKLRMEWIRFRAKYIDRIDKIISRLSG